MSEDAKEQPMKLIKDRLHSKLLVPWDIAQQGKGAVIDWITNQQNMYRFKEGEEVAHKECLTKKMFVSEILKEMKEIPSGFGNGKKKKFTRCLGVMGHDFEAVDG